MKTILVPTDFSPCASVAINYAVKLAQKADAEIILVHSCDLLESKFSDYKFLIKEYNDSIKSELYSKLNRLKYTHENEDGVRIFTKLYEGENITDCILKAAKDFHAELIVMGTQGSTNLRNQFFGSNSADVINKSEIPVLTIPCNYEWTLPEEILIAINDVNEDAEILKPVIEIAQIFNAKIFLAIFTEEEAEAGDLLTQTRALQLIEYRLKKVFKETPFEVNHLTGADFKETVQRFIAEKNIDLLTMVTYKRDFWQNIFDSSKTQKMSYSSFVPLLSIHSAYH